MIRPSPFIVSTFVVVAALVTGCESPAAPAAATSSAVAKQPSVAPISVHTGEVDLREMPKLATLLGNVVPDRHSEVAANVSGRVVVAAIERGQAVRAGETLVIVDSKAAGYSASAAVAQAQLADTQVVQARLDCERAERLYQQGAMGKAEYDRQHTQCKAQELQATAARAQAGLSSKLASDSVVRAPFAGIIGERLVNPGEYVQPHTRIATMYTLDPVRVVISVPEHGVSLVRTGVTVDLEVAAWPGRVFPATVEYVSPTLRTLQRDLLVEAKASNADGALRPGMFATVSVVMGQERVVTVPSDAIVTQDDVRRLFVVREGQAFEMVVRIGVTREQRTVIYEDVAPGTIVVRNPPGDMRDGAPLVIDGSRAQAPALQPAVAATAAAANPATGSAQ